MKSLPFSQLPGMNALFLDSMDSPEKVQDFYPSRETIRSTAIPHREALCDILARQNQGYGNQNAEAMVQKLRDPQTSCVITGQQIGLLTGPLYTIWKALTALRFAESMQAQGISCVPVFWMATEDHNWHEITHFALLKPDLELMQFSLKEHLFLSRQPTGTISTQHQEIRKILIRALREIQIAPVKEYYSTGTLATAFARTLLWLLKDFSILIVDPSDPDLKKLASPFFTKFFDRSNQLLHLLSKQNELLRNRNYPVQVAMEEGTLPIFTIEQEERAHLKTGSYENMPAEKLSPSALLRPLFQDFLFPTLAYIGGPGEMAYFAQLHPWYEAMDMQQPWLLPRASITLLPPATRGFLQSRSLKPEELFIKEDALVDALLDSEPLKQTKNHLKELKKNVMDQMGKIKLNAQKMEATLGKAADTAERKVLYQLDKMERKTFFAAKRKNYLLGEQIRKAKNVIYPGEKLQERYLNVFSFAQHLPDLIHNIYSKIDPETKAHLWLDL